MNPEAALLSRARRLDQRTLGEIYDHHSPGLYRYAMRLLGDIPLAEDCVADTFTRFLQALHRGGGPRQHLQAYLYRIAHNWITDHYRRNTLVSMPLTADMHNPLEAGLDHKVEIQIEHQRVRAALFHLTPEQRQVIVLKYLEGWRNSDIALTMDKSVGAIKALQHRALAALQRLLTNEEELA